ncbi:MAG: hypothetical protein JO286_07860 [Solirubrobacterales bacterium]|nr:hypothetical protein [Solirubrobacterales bacterium]MBV9367550.1 hypothetical protein [Solirubrobacterales bacterium]MBV9683709.1 hypothetical protein [Solirubrobacterales bacterium]MBV9807081.1 hypothetical protein [Solirubrobacterales bacterium]
MNARRLTSIAGVALAVSALGATQLAAGATPARTVRVSAQLKVASTVNGLGGAPQSCLAGICKIKNRGTGRMTHFGKVTFTSVITADDNQPPCGTSSQWVNRIIRTIHTSRGILVLHEAGLQCPEPGVGPRVEAVWTVDGAESTGIFAGAQGGGYDIAYPVQDTAAPHGTITLAP